MSLILNNKKVVKPPQSGMVFKELFQFACDAGAGVNAEMGNDGVFHWTPDTLATAIITRGRPTVDVSTRTVQLWFQRNDRTISDANIRNLSIVFGCGEGVLTSEWQRELLKAKRRQKNERSRDETTTDSGIESKRTEFASSSNWNSVQPPTASLSSRLSARLEGLFADPIIPSAIVWFWLTGILFLAAILGVLSVDYTTPDGTSKQVGYIWTPSWIIHDLVLLPTFLMIVSNVINFWKTDARLLFLDDISRRSPDEGWLEKVNSLSILHWLALAISAIFVFLLQWVGGYMVPILNNEIGNTAVSWVNIVLARPDIMSVGGALALSGFYFLFAAIVFFFLNAGLVFLYAVWSDFCDLCKNKTTITAKHDGAKIRFFGIRLVGHIFLATIMALWISTSIKLYAMYLSVDSKDILTWIYTDFHQLSTSSEQHKNIIVGYSLSQFSTIIFTSVIAGVFFYIYFSARLLLNRRDSGSDLYPNIYAPWRKWLFAVILLLVNFVCVGQVRGFSLLLLFSLVVTVYCVYTHRGRNVVLD